MLDTLQIHIANQESNYLKDLLPVITAILGTVLGFFLSVMRDWFKERKKFNETRKYFFYSLYNLKVALSNQIISYDKFISKLIGKDNTLPSFELDAGFSLRAINVVNHEDLFKIFSKKNINNNINSIFDLSNLVNSFELIQSVVDNSEKETLHIHSSIDSRLARFNDLFNKLRDEIYKLQTVDLNAVTPGENPFINRITKVGNEFQEWKDTNNKNDMNINIYEHVEHLIIPLKEIVVEFDYFQMLGYISDIEQTIFELDANKEIFEIKFNSDKDALLKIKNHIIKLLKSNNIYLDKYILDLDKDIMKQS